MTRPVALVTGAARGIGQAIAQRLTADGFDVIGFDRLAFSMTPGRAVLGDVSSEADVLKLFEGISRLDVAVNCAGVQLIKPLVETSAADLDAIIAVNLRGTFLVGREAAKIMLRQEQGGRIINIASELAYSGRANFSAYCATKGAILSLTRSWARELAPRVLVNAVAPGPTDTPMIEPAQRPHETEDVPLGRMAQPQEIAATVAFLAGPEASYFTGQCISPNGGAVMF
jgi:3-oxoacyl-[acyl-carrier protein] reductase